MSKRRTTGSFLASKHILLELKYTVGAAAYGKFENLTKTQKKRQRN